MSILGETETKKITIMIKIENYSRARALAFMRAMEKLKIWQKETEHEIKQA